MIVDCHTHIWESVEQLGRGTGLWSARSRGRRGNQAPRADIARYVRRNSSKLVGFASVDPSRPQEAIDDLRQAHDELGLKGVSIWPAAQDFHPASSSAMRVYTEISRLRMPVMIHQDVRASEDSKMEFARPYLVDEIAREFPDLRIIIPQLGYPWTEETIVLLAKHHNVFADISGLVHHGWTAYHALLSAYQAGVMDALLFGSDFPHTTAAACIEALYSINQFCHGTALPTIPREQLRQIVERDVLALLHIESERAEAMPEPDSTVIQVEE